MQKFVTGSRIIVAGLAQTAEAMAFLINAMPRATVSQCETDAKASTARLRIKPRKIKLGDFEDDMEALRRDMLVLGEDMKKARMK